MAKIRKLKRVVVKEELVALTGKVDHAIILNQFIYWSERAKDVDKFLAEEMERIRKFSDGSVESEADIRENLTNGWIYKSAEEMKEECMFEKSVSTVERIIKDLVDKGWLDRRRNPKYKWDKTYQYRVNILKIQHDLMKLGYSLDDYSLGDLPREILNEASNPQNEESNLQNADSKRHFAGSNLQNEDPNPQNEESNPQNEESNLQNDVSNLQNEGAIPEITTEIISEINSKEITSEINSKSVSAKEKSGDTLNELLSFIESRPDLKKHTLEIIKIFIKAKEKENFTYEIFKDTLEIIDLDIDGIEYFKRALVNNLRKGHVRKQPKNSAEIKPIRKEPIPDWFNKENVKFEQNLEELLILRDRLAEEAKNDPDPESPFIVQLEKIEEKIRAALNKDNTL